MQSLWVLVSIVVVLALVSASGDTKKKGKPLFPENHPNITFLTDKNWDEYMAKTDKPWLVDFYHPFCPHCKHFAPTFIEVAAYYKEKGTVYVGAVSCMDHVKCRRVGITGFPTLMTLNFDKKHPKEENKRIVGTHTLQEVKDYVTEVSAEVAFNTTGTWPPGYKPTKSKSLEEKKEKKEDEKPTPKPTMWEESTLPMNQTTRLQDAASAFVFGLKQGVFMGSDLMEDEEFDALRGWLKMVSETFPGAINRKVIRSLYDQVKDKELLDFDTWDAIVKKWQEGSVSAFLKEEARFNFTGVIVPEWQRLNDLFLGEGATYRACALYTCGQWNMFHMLTLNPTETGARSAELMVSVTASIRRFVKHFFGCVNCRDHFLKENTIATVKKIKDAEDKPLALRRWLWNAHNSVNKRLNHPIWPKSSSCPTCGSEAAWEMVEVDKWLRRTYAYRDAVVPLAKNTGIVSETAAVALRKETDEITSEKPKTTTGPIAVEPKGGDDYQPKDAELGIKNAANTLDLVSDMKNVPKDGLQEVTAPPVSLFAWYIVPIAAMASYFVYVRLRSSKQKVYRQLPRK